MSNHKQLHPVKSRDLHVSHPPIPSKASPLLGFPVAKTGIQKRAIRTLLPCYGLQHAEQTTPPPMRCLFMHTNDMPHVAKATNTVWMLAIGKCMGVVI